MRSGHTYKKENRFFYIAILHSKLKSRYGWKKFASWALCNPYYAVSLLRVLVAQRRRIDQLEYDLHITRHSRDYYMGECLKNGK